MKTLRYAVVLALLIISTASLSSTSPTAIDCASSPIGQFTATYAGVAIDSPWVFASANQQQPPPPGCCKVCTRGKACGDTCIARDKTCHVGPGCACDG